MIVPAAALLALQVMIGLLHGPARGLISPTVQAPAAAPRPMARAPICSIHVPARNEPPAVLIRTLSALAAQVDAPPYEVIVIINNSPDPSLAEPVEAWCRGRPDFRYLFRDGVKGAKAGALNICLAETRADATHIVTVDADYVAEPNFLARAAQALSDWDADFIQFPQAYEGEHLAAGAARELSDYFRRHARTANGADAMLPTGTLSVISKASLEAVGGWRGDTVTEDAELGVRLCRHGFRGRFVDSRVGRGLLPFDFASLHVQRFRWTTGNVRTLLLGLDGLPWRRRLLIFSQLTAWATLAQIFLAALAGGALRLALEPGDAAASTLCAIAAAGLTSCYLAALVPLADAAARDGVRGSTLLHALATRIALLPSSALATAVALCGARPAFAITAKTVRARRGGMPWPVLAWAATGAALVLLTPSNGVAIGALLAVLPLPAALMIERRLRSYASSMTPAGA